MLNLEETGNLPVMDQPNVTFESGTVNAKGGAVITLYSIKVMDATLNIDTSEVADGGWNDGLYANGSVEIYGGDVNINAGRAGILVVGIGAPEPKTGLIIKDGKVDINAKLADIYLGTDNIKNGLISGGDITLGGDIGIFLNDCEKCEIKGGTFHTDECENHSQFIETVRLYLSMQRQIIQSLTRQKKLQRLLIRTTMWTLQP